ncbi:uncharacterized protein BKA55DRAFT_692260 [Fusarium redolens]|uniref:Uncharacterized protein n=1 Tax=Fusarium redolens TaxID=48865 RepID=A0A9P9GTL3_FUSRE|nr:uncharacterized protein BKA55DRAFT_692260 [Fusarium redolens]KAH7244460.1 hypothetical protein BKA55DRAFT_692260 [Fusarium redolens]
MEPRPHDPNLSETLQPLIEIDEFFLAEKMKQAVNLVSELKAQGKRVLIYVRENSTATKLNEKMRAHGLNSHEVATIWARPECRNIIFNFNDANHPTDVVITTFATLKAPGPRFYGASRHGIFLEIAEDLEDYILATRGLYSISRTQAAEWTSYYVRETLDMVRDLAMARKAVSRIARNPAVYPEITGDLRGILAFYEVALAMGHAVSLFYFAVAKFLRENASAAAKFKKSTMARIARSWRPGQALTMDHVNLKLPAIDDGVVLYNYVNDGYKQQL